MKASVVTVCFNSAATVADTLRSVAAQSHPLVEHVIVDGGSTDATMALVRTHGARVGPCVSEPDRGIYDAMNKGLAMSTGGFVGFLNSDDVYADVHVLAEVALAFAGGADYVYGDIEMVDDHGRVVRHWHAGRLPGGRLRHRQLPHPAFFVRRDWLMRLEPAFDVSLRIAADLKQQLILIDKLGAQGTYLERPLARMRVGGASTANLGSLMEGWRESRLAYDQVFGGGGRWYTLAKVAAKLGGIRSVSHLLGKRAP
jgi:glycosyltransferase involved in cell wall biosynthesis